MGIFKKKKRDYGYGYSNTLEKMILEDDAPDDEKEKINPKTCTWISGI